MTRLERAVVRVAESVERGDPQRDHAALDLAALVAGLIDEARSIELVRSA